ncbi:replicative DNA helicase [Alcaligenaceae bacterium]|nr:replicative DNA helicase [Alcaligenaceae bacterium]
MNHDNNLNIPPHSVEAEQSVLGGLLLDNRAWERLDGQLAEGDFYRADNRRIFGTVAAMLDRGEPADVVTVYTALQAGGDTDQVGGLPYLNALAHNTPSAANIRRYAEIVRGHRVRRDVMSFGNRIAALAGGADVAPGELVERVTGEAMALADTRAAGHDPQTVGELLPGLLDELQARVDRGGSISGQATGFGDLDRLTSGLQPGDLIIVAGRPSMGKTTLAVNIAENVAVAGGTAFVVSLEMSAAQLAERSVARFGGIDTQRMRSGALDSEDFTRLSGSLARLQDQRLIVADDPAMASVARIRLAARKVKQRHGSLSVLVIDYLQLMRGDGSTRNEELGGITRSLKLLARELGCPIVLLSQLSRAVESRPDKRPMMSDLRESGAIEQDADVVLMAYRDDYYNPNSPLRGYAEILIRKQRMGPLGVAHLVFQGQHSRFLDADQKELAAVLAAADAKPNSAPKRGFYG